MTTGRARVLIVDDAADLRELMTIALQREGFEVLCVETGQAAADLLAVSHVDIVVLDIQMPELDGWEVLERIRGEPATATLPVIVCTVKGRDDDRERVWRAGGDAYVAKPFDIGVLVETISRVLGRRSSPMDRVD